MVCIRSSTGSTTRRAAAERKPRMPTQQSDATDNGTATSTEASVDAVIGPVASHHDVEKRSGAESASRKPPAR